MRAGTATSIAFSWSKGKTCFSFTKSAVPKGFERRIFFRACQKNKKRYNLYKKREKNMKKNTHKKEIIARQLFLTLSQTQLTVQEVYDKLLLEDKLEHLAVVLETHTKDVSKGKHIHVYLSYLKKKDHLSLRHFDFLQNGVHVERVKNIECVLAYMSKENECKANFDVWRKLLAHSRNMAAKTVTRMAELGHDLKEVQVKYSDLLCNLPWETMRRFAHGAAMSGYDMAKRKLPSQQLRWIDRELIEARLTPEELAIFDSDPQFQTLVDYINKVKKFGSRQIHKECCLSLVSVPSTGKSSLLLKLAEHYNNYNFPIDGWHRETYRNDIYSMWTWNEWDIGSVNWSDLLLLLEGFETDLRVKGSKTVKLDRPMLFLVSNETYQRQYEKRFGYLKRQSTSSYNIRKKALDVRIQELNFGEQNLFFLQKLFVSVSDDVNIFETISK